MNYICPCGKEHRRLAGWLSCHPDLLRAITDTVIGYPGAGVTLGDITRGRIPQRILIPAIAAATRKMFDGTPGTRNDVHGGTLGQRPVSHRARRKAPQIR